ncbi:cytochrome P450 [Dacryopinax primogenitus]|uniref:Cytochrome P450 n=1 Tax=Dacryopinax primogenitus (strain DJM 731) TaxID=1858805 RepID=M5GAR5_DACPD|nr:cytochrome P450 [Dacryopinax primogenitus]EJU05969.1 cytochrome P450 [Dacryopinax primogenitus]
MHIPDVTADNAVASALAEWMIVAYDAYMPTCSHTRIKLRGPPRPSWLYGYNKIFLTTPSAQLHETWQAKYGDAYSLPVAVGETRIALLDPKALVWVFSSNVYNYVRPVGQSKLVASLVWDDHKRIRKTMMPGFTPAALRSFTTVFLEEAYHVKDAWSTMFSEQKGGLDSIGKAGFGHDFASVTGEKPLIQKLLDSFGTSRQSPITALVLSLVHAFPILVDLPTKRKVFRDKLRMAMMGIATDILEESHKVGEEGRKSLIENVLSRSTSFPPIHHSWQINTIMFAGYDTTSTTLLWALHELSLNPTAQSKLREELSQFHEPTYDHLREKMVYLDAVVKEVLRLHPSIVEIYWNAIKDDVLPLARPITTASGEQISQIPIKGGQGITVPIEALVRSPAIWGEDSHEFRPERWNEHLPERVREFHAWSNLWTFGDGPRGCIGRTFAIAELKAVICILIQNFTFEPLTPGGKDVRRVPGVTPRPVNDGSHGLKLRVSQIGMD